VAKKANFKIEGGDDIRRRLEAGKLKCILNLKEAK
jgi:hypothetical protein